MQYTVGSLFAGIGGIDLAFENAGAKILWANEMDENACQTYQLNFPNSKLLKCDVKELDPRTLSKVDILAAGFPCQSFSIAGKQLGFDDPRGQLFFEIERIAKGIKPRVLFLENVSNLVFHDQGKTFNTVINTLHKCGYSCCSNIMNACDYGVPQRRNRVFIVAFRKLKDMQNFTFPAPVPLNKTAFDLLDTDKKDEKYYLKNYENWNEVEPVVENGVMYIYSKEGNISPQLDVCPTLMASMSRDYRLIPFFKDKYSIRMITEQECARMQGLPESFKFPKEFFKRVYKQVGNSVAVPLVEKLAKNILLALQRSDN